MTEQLEVIAAQSQTDVWEDFSAIFHQEDPTYKGQPVQTQYARGHFNDNYEAGK